MRHKFQQHSVSLAVFFSFSRGWLVAVGWPICVATLLATAVVDDDYRWRLPWFWLLVEFINTTAVRHNCYVHVRKRQERFILLIAVHYLSESIALCICKYCWSKWGVYAYVANPKLRQGNCLFRIPAEMLLELFDPFKMRNSALATACIFYNLARSRDMISIRARLKCHWLYWTYLRTCIIAREDSRRTWTDLPHCPLSVLCPQMPATCSCTWANSWLST
jgi:hypothetical protein